MCHMCLQYAEEQARQEVEGSEDWELTDIIDQLTYIPFVPYGSDEVIEYAFPKDGSFWAHRDTHDNVTGHSELNEFQKSQARIAYSLWDDLIVAKLEETTDAVAADMTLSNTTSGIGLAHAQTPGGAAWLNAELEVLQQPGDRRDWGFLTIVHEFGHSMGLLHSHTHDLDSHMYSVMSYRGADVTGADPWGADGKQYHSQTPMLHDILAVQQMYGADMTTRTGDTVYGFNSNTNSPIFDFEQNANPFLAIWDAGGIDTLDLSGFAPGQGNKGSVINLAPGTFSDTASMTKNISIAYDAWIENATGGRGNDTITGNKLANTLIGNAGNDVLNGAAGDDYLDGGTGRDRLNGGAGNDILVYDASDWISDLDGGSGTDLLLVTGGRVPTFDLASRNIEFADHVQTVSRNVASWSTKTDHYNSAWEKLSQDGTNDDGSSWKTVWDDDNSKNWVSYSNNFDREGRLTEQSGELDNGQTWQHVWNFDQGTDWSYTTTLKDTANTTWWAETTKYVDENGQILTQSGIKDNGHSWVHTYDVNDTETWARHTSTYDAEGRNFLLSGETDAGETWKEHFDVGDDYWWKEHLNTFNANGQKVSQVGEKDNGQTWEHTWDVTGTETWSRKTVSEDNSDLTWWSEHYDVFQRCGRGLQTDRRQGQQPNLGAYLGPGRHRALASPNHHGAGSRHV